MAVILQHIYYVFWVLSEEDSSIGTGTHTHSHEENVTVLIGEQVLSPPNGKKKLKIIIYREFIV